MQQKEDYKPVQHPPQQVAVSLKPTYRAKLDRLLMLGIITELKEYTEWVSSIVPVKKQDGSLGICLDAKDLNRNIKQKQWYSKIFDDILPDLPDPTLFMLLDVKSGYWHVTGQRK